MAVPIKVTKDSVEIQKLKVQEIVDSTESTGTTGQALTRTSEGVKWATVSSGEGGGPPYDDTELRNRVIALEEALTWIEK